MEKEREIGNENLIGYNGYFPSKYKELIINRNPE